MKNLKIGKRKKSPNRRINRKVDGEKEKERKREGMIVNKDEESLEK